MLKITFLSLPPIKSLEGEFANRRDKKVQQELVRAAGMRAVRQACGEKFSEVEQFLRSETFPVVLKPTDSAGSDGVKLCETFEEAKEHFEYLLTVEAVNGGYNEKVLCQEFLRGKEVSNGRIFDSMILLSLASSCSVHKFYSASCSM